MTRPLKSRLTLSFPPPFEELVAGGDESALGLESWGKSAIAASSGNSARNADLFLARIHPLGLKSKSLWYDCTCENNFSGVSIVPRWKSRVLCKLLTKPVVLLLLSFLPDGVSRFTRKHGHWKHHSLFPATFLVLSAVALSPSQAKSFMAFKPGQVRYKLVCTLPLNSNCTTREITLDCFNDKPVNDITLFSPTNIFQWHFDRCHSVICL